MFERVVYHVDNNIITFSNAGYKVYGPNYNKTQIVFKGWACPSLREAINKIK